MPITNQTPHRGIQLPDEDNNLDFDVGRLIAAFTKVDTDLHDLFTSVSGLALVNHTHTIAQVSGLEDALLGKAASDHTHALGALSDVNATGATTGQFLRKNASGWGPANIGMSEVTNLNTVLATKAALKGSSIVVPFGDSAGRPTGVSGEVLFRRNTETSQFEFWDGTGWNNFSTFDSSLYVPKAGGTYTGNVSGPRFDAESLRVAGAASGLRIYDRTNPANYFLLYSVDNELCIAFYNGTTTTLRGKFGQDGRMYATDFGIL